MKRWGWLDPFSCSIQLFKTSVNLLFLARILPYLTTWMAQWPSLLCCTPLGPRASHFLGWWVPHIVSTWTERQSWHFPASFSKSSFGFLMSLFSTAFRPSKVVHCSAPWSPAPLSLNILYAQNDLFSSPNLRFLDWTLPKVRLPGWTNSQRGMRLTRFSW